MNRISSGTNVFIYPMPVVLVGTNVKGRANSWPWVLSRG
jgi:hypothetical protein